jgi:hypothetical protein
MDIYPKGRFALVEVVPTHKPKLEAQRIAAQMPQWSVGAISGAAIPANPKRATDVLLSVLPFPTCSPPLRGARARLAALKG